MSQFRSEVLGWFDAGRVVAGREREVLCRADIMPGPPQWRVFLSQLSLWLGTIALAAAVIFFFAFNWADLGRFAKFGLVEAAIVAGLLACWRFDLDGAPGKAVLVLLSLLVGALLALTGQIYQTGADMYELFVWWAVLILPWVLVGRFSPLWLVWLGLINLALYLYFELSHSLEPLLWTQFGLNTLALVAWEAAHRAGLAWLRDSWPPRLVAVASGFMATALAIWAIADSSDPAQRALATLAYVAWLGAIYGWYRYVRPDLFMLAGGWLSLIAAVTVFLGDALIDSGAGALLLIGMVVIGMAAGGAFWLRSAAREMVA
jgi:uncharacterized membrane protein